MLDRDRIEKEKLEMLKKLYEDAFLELERANIEEVSKNSNVNYITTRKGYKKILISYLNKEITVDIDNKNIYWSDTAEKIDLHLAVITIHYLLGCTLRRGGIEWISYREIPGASFYSKTIPNTLNPLVKFFSEKPDKLVLAAQNLGGKEIPIGDKAVELKPFPKFPIAFVIYNADEEFPASANVLYDKSVKDVLSAEEVKLLTIFLINELINVRDKT
jgi:hypothetical protein